MAVRVDRTGCGVAAPHCSQLLLRRFQRRHGSKAFAFLNYNQSINQSSEDHPLRVCQALRSKLQRQQHCSMHNEEKHPETQCQTMPCSQTDKAPSNHAHALSDSPLLQYCKQPPCQQSGREPLPAATRSQGLQSPKTERQLSTRSSNTQTSSRI